MFFVRAYDKESKPILGSDGAFIAQLKTWRGVRHRIWNFHWNKNTIFVGVSQFDDDIYAEKSIEQYIALLGHAEDMSKALLQNKPITQ